MVFVDIGRLTAFYLASRAVTRDGRDVGRHGRAATISATSAGIEVVQQMGFTAIRLFVSIAVIIASRTDAVADALRASDGDILRGTDDPATTTIRGVARGIGFATVDELVIVAVRISVMAASGTFSCFTSGVKVLGAACPSTTGAMGGIGAGIGFATVCGVSIAITPTRIA